MLKIERMEQVFGSKKRSVLSKNHENKDNRDAKDEDKDTPKASVTASSKHSRGYSNVDFN